ncbi:MAG: FAD-dependent oxidoreductase, partial [Planctomycetes bacterium]|nr:FAD-dependent oxidoreductase [Planctomycetota bacterium]
MSDQTIVVPDIGDFDQVDVIEVLVSPGDAVQAEDSLITLESDKATMEIPSPQAGMVREIHVSPGDKVSQGSAILTLDIGASSDAEPPQQTRREPSAREEEKEDEKSGVNEQNNPQSAGKSASRAEVVVIGAGPGGYTAAFRAADLGKRVTLIERYPTLGGVCLNVGCIPSKALLHVAGLLGAVDDLAAQGVRFGAPEIELDTLRKWKTGVVKRLTDGLDQLAARRKVTVVQGTAKFVSAHALEIDTDEGVQLLEFDHAIIAAGSQPSRLPFIPYDDPRVMDSTDALRLESIPDRLLVIGGGIIGLEMASVFDALGSKVTVVELSDSLMPGCDPDLLRPLTKRIERRYENIFRNTRVVAVDAQEDGLEVRFEGEDAPSADRFDAILVAVGRRPNGPAIAAEAAGVHVDDNGFIPVDEQQRTNVPHILAIGDIVGEPQLAHKATHQGKVAA